MRKVSNGFQFFTRGPLMPTESPAAYTTLIAGPPSSATLDTDSGLVLSSEPTSLNFCPWPTFNRKDFCGDCAYDAVAARPITMARLDEMIWRVMCFSWCGDRLCFRRQPAAFGQQFLQPVDFSHFAPRIGRKRGNRQPGLGQGDCLRNVAFGHGHGRFGAQAGLHFETHGSRP